MTLLKKFSFVAPLVASLLAIAAQPASAGTVYSINVGNVPGLGAFTGPYANLEVNLLSSTQADFKITALTHTTGATNYQFLVIPTNAVGLELNDSLSAGSASYYTVGPVTGSIYNNPAVVPISVTPNYNQTEDGFGKFVLNLEGTGSGPFQSYSYLHFTVTDTAANWATSADVLSQNSTGFYAGMHMGALNLTTGATAFTNTGYGSNLSGGTTTDVNPVPEPTSLAVWGLVSLVGFGYSRRRKAC